jgi:hypothetical protein
MLREPAGILGAPRSRRDVLRAAAVVALGASLAGACASEKDTGVGRCRWSRLPRRLSATRFTGVSMALIVVLSKGAREHPGRGLPGKWAVRFLVSCVLVLLPWTTSVALSSVELSSICWLWLLDSIYSPIDWVLRPGCAGSGGEYVLARPARSVPDVRSSPRWPQ